MLSEAEAAGSVLIVLMETICFYYSLNSQISRSQIRADNNNEDGNEEIVSKMSQL